MSLISLTLNVFGLIGLTWFISKLYKLITQLTRSAKNLKKYGEWSIVTGATSGIGNGIAYELAKRGQNILLIGRNLDKLNKTKQELNSTHSSINIEILQINLSNITKENENSFSNFIKLNNVGCLINNAGLSYNYTKYFDDVDKNRIENIINVNDKAITILSYLFIKEILKKKTSKKNKNKGCIINISSAGSIVPHELHCVYSASKAYVNKFTLDLALEYQKKGIHCSVQLPFFVVSNMSKIKKPSLTVPSAKAYAKSAVNQFGYSGICSPYPIHAIIFFILSFVPEKLLEILIGNMHRNVMKKGNYKYQKTFAFIKPDAYEKKDEIIELIKKNNFEIVKSKDFKLNKNTAELFYIEHKDKGFFKNLIDYITSGNVVAMILQKKDCVKEWRKLIGPTNPVDAKKDSPNSIRALYGKNLDANAVHGSDSTQSAKREYQLIFE